MNAPDKIADKAWNLARHLSSQMGFGKNIAFDEERPTVEGGNFVHEFYHMSEPLTVTIVLSTTKILKVTTNIY